MLPYGASVDGLLWLKTFACSIIKSLSLMTSGLAVKTGLEGHRCFSYCLNLMLISHFKLFQSSSQRGQLCFHLHIVRECINASPLIGCRPHFLSFPRVWFIPCFRGLGYIIEEIHGLIWIFTQEVSSSHGFQQLLHGRRHSIIKMID